ncbi:Carboxypeptidase B,Carboxypeptidase O [Lepeophtheirus salmonis]|uniref:Carboxypeptidase B,Carboxypeptidase O n=1 Tax=Lepeophtheirus salmonis TaxID=72036 RepID=A0A7R8CZQ4_LEPSM|nr:Carboxypeptidase B,Carboxypeptidase O [Lepeophtheirus salmonis]CAF2978006.1 Carboxypeptidase B,Carboxypeptidase O [Lepeophtheirus salmonis]
MIFKYSVIWVNIVLMRVSLSEARDYTNYKLLKVEPGSSSDRNLLYHQLVEDVDFWTEPSTLKNELQFMVGPHQLSRVMGLLDSFNISSTVLMENVQDLINKQINEIQDHDCSMDTNKRKKRGIFDDLFNFFSRQDEEELRVSTNEEPSFRSPRKINSFDNSFKNDVTSIGKSYEGRDLLVFKIGTPQPNYKPAIFIEGGIHAREWISPAATTYIIKEFVNNYEKNKEILDVFDFYILPILNPDGYAYTFRKDRLWRKSRSRNGGLIGAILPGCVGVDLNRNFGYKWLAKNSLFNARGGSRLTCLETYAGSKPFSEPETRALSNFLLNNKDKFQGYLSIHSFGQKVIYPYSYTNVKIKDWKELHQMGNVIANTISKYSGVDAIYDVGTSSDVQYRASGGADDYVRGALGIKWVFLIELPDKGRHGFFTSPSSDQAGFIQCFFKESESLPTKSHRLCFMTKQADKGESYDELNTAVLAHYEKSTKQMFDELIAPEVMIDQWLSIEVLKGTKDNSLVRRISIDPPSLKNSSRLLNLGLELRGSQSGHGHFEPKSSSQLIALRDSVTSFLEPEQKTVTSSPYKRHFRDHSSLL